MTGQPTAVFFDMDGTILDWQSGMEETWRASMERHNDGSYEVHAMHELIRTRRDWFWSDPERARTGRLDLDEASRVIVRSAFEDAGLTALEVADSIANWYRRERAKALVPYPGAIETLEAFRSRDIPLALLTNGGATSQRASVERHNLEAYFHCIVIEGEFGAGKPDERVFRHALQATGSEPETTWMVGDNLAADIAPAVELGMHAVWVDERGEGLPEGAPTTPHRIIRAITELIERS